MRQSANVFDYWQPKYAARGIPTFPVKFEIDADGKIKKKPAVTNWPTIGERRSTELTRRHGAAQGVGLVLGRHTGLAIVDIDGRDENLVADALAYHGNSPLIVRSPTGGLHIYYKHDGRQRRQVRSHPHWKERNAPVDVLGGGFAVVPGSVSPNGAYEFIQGGLDDLARLPRLRGGGNPRLSKPAPEVLPESPLRDMRQGDGRNETLFRAIGPIARQIHERSGTADEVLTIARRLNSECAAPMQDAEVQQIAEGVWAMTVQHRNWIGRAAVVVDIEDINRMVRDDQDQDAFLLLMFLRAHHQARGFVIANALAPTLGWPLRRLRAARTHLIESRRLVQIRRNGRGRPPLFRFAYPR